MPRSVKQFRITAQIGISATCSRKSRVERRWPEGANLSAVRIKLRDDSIYEIDITADGKKATVLYADPWCPQPDVFIVLGPENTLGGAVAQALINCGWRGWKNKSGFRSSNEEKPRLISLGLSE